MSYIFSIFLALLIIYIIHRLTKKIKPKIIMNEDSKIAKIVKNMQTVKFYRPTPWLINGHLQTIWGMKLKGRIEYKPEKEDINFEDGGQVTIEHFVKDKLSEDAPILFVIHTMGGGTREPCTFWAAYNFMLKYYRVVVCSCRGCNGSKLKTKRICDSTNYQDTHVIIEKISKRFPKAKKKFLIGFSMGGIIGVNYSTVYSDLDGIVSVSHIIDNEGSDLLLLKGINKYIYAFPLLKSLIRGIKKSSVYTEEEKKRISYVKTSAEFHDLVSAKNAGLKDSKEYYKITSLSEKPKSVKIPTIVIVSSDDPLVREDFLDLAPLVSPSNIYLSLILTNEGGHVSFAEGIYGKDSWVEKVAEEFFNKL